MTDEEQAPRFGISRRERIMDELRRVGAVRVADLARELGVAELTIRRDIGALADRGLLTRVHGGATLRSALDTAVVRGGPAASRFRIGMVVPSLSYYWPQVVIGARAAATELGAQLILRGASYAADDQRRQIASLVDAGTVHGLIAAPESLGPDGHALLQWLDALPLPVVLVERRAPSTLALSGLESVTTDHAFGGALAARHLFELGHRRVGILTSAPSPTSGRLRRGWDRAVDRLGLTATVAGDVSRDRLDAEERDAAVTALRGAVRATGATAMLIHADPQALLVQQHAVDSGWSLPDELSIVAYDDEVAESGTPPITALRPPKQHVGRRAVEVLLARLDEGRRRPVERVQVVPSLHVRASTAPYAE